MRSMRVCVYRYVVFTSVENVFRFIYASLNHDHGKVFHIQLTRLEWVKGKHHWWQRRQLRRWYRQQKWQRRRQIKIEDECQLINCYYPHPFVCLCACLCACVCAGEFDIAIIHWVYSCGIVYILPALIAYSSDAQLNN